MGVRKRETYVNVQCNPSPHPNTVLLSSLVQASWGKETKSVSAGSAAPLWSGLGRINRLRLFLPRIASFLSLAPKQYDANFGRVLPVNNGSYVPIFLQI